jgi:hypothetical protein
MSPSDFCVKMGCTPLISKVTEVFEFFKTSYLEELPEKQRKFVDFTNLMYVGAVLYLCAKFSKMKLEKKQLVKELCCSESDFTSISEIVEKKCEKFLKDQPLTVEFKTKKKIKKVKEIPKEKESLEEFESKIETKLIEQVVKDAPNEESVEKEIVNQNEDEENISKKRKFEEDVNSETKVQKKRKQVTLHYFQKNPK